ncbi:MAG: homocysteine S-methyltransferase family protein [Slackia sp.]|nr:homocysteine S-methyltransferase family protein [Slackia sp.]
MLPITSKAVSADARDRLRIADDYLERVIAGEEYLVFDGAMGTMLQAAGLEAGELPELLCLTSPDEVTAIHRRYVEAGSQAVTTNTFGANARKLGDAASVHEVFAAAVSCVRAAGARYVAADIGPTGALLAPLGTMSFDEAYNLFAEQVHAAVDAGADIILIETMADLLEMKAAVLAAKECSDLPVFATMTFGEDGRTFLGTSPRIAALMLSSLGVQALGMNCSLGPDDLRPLVDEMLEVATCPVMVQANAGLPHVEDGRTVFSVDADAYAESVAGMIEAGVRIVGGCCGTNPAYIANLADIVRDKRPHVPFARPLCSVTSAQEAVVLEGRHVATIGERINPTGKKRLKEALRTGDSDYIINEAIAQTEAGADILDVNAGLPEIDEAAVLVDLVGKIQGVTGLPLQIDSSDPAAVEAAVRVYAGKPIINSVNGKAESLETVLPVAKHYGCAVVGLTLDEGGIPPTAEERFAIAERIVRAAEAKGIPRQDVLIDCLVMAASTNQSEVVEILRAITIVKERLGVRTVLGVSNVSFGLPLREVVNATFLSAAFSAGLDMPILNPLSERYCEVVDSWRVLCGQDVGAMRYIEGYANKTAAASTTKVAAHAGSNEGGASAAEEEGLRHFVITGRRAAAGAEVERMLDAGEDPMAVIDGHLIPALDEVGARFEAGTFFLPQLMASAEAAKAGFDVIRGRSTGDAVADKGSVAVATVKGDIHDIGKNIVRMLLENYGYTVYDLGRDVEPQAVVDCVKEHDIKLVGLSALMTTTVRGMEETIALLREQAPDTKVFVGGAVLTPEYAQMVGADYYAKDAAEGARICAEVLG